MSGQRGYTEGQGEPVLPSRDPRLTLTRELLEKYLSGDRESETRLFESHRAELVARARTASWMPGLRKLVAPEDLVQEVFVRALSSGLLRDFQDRGRGSLLAALTRVLDGVAVDTYRRHGALKRGGGAVPCSYDHLREDGDTRSAVDLPPSPDTTPTSSARERELVELVHGWLEPREWETWRLCEREGLDPRAAAERLGTTESAVRGVMHRARKRILRAMACAPGRGLAGHPEGPEGWERPERPEG